MTNLFGEEIITVTDQDFETLWLAGEWRKLGKKEAYRHFRKTVKAPADLARIQKAADNYRRDLKQNPRPPLHGSTFFNNWEDFEVLEYNAPRSTNGDNHGRFSQFVRSSKNGSAGSNGAT